MGNPKDIRCFGTGDPLMERYHDQEWGFPVHGDRDLFEHLILDCFQAGLSWRTILHKRENFREAFEGFDPERVARYRKRDIQRLLRDPGIVRNRLKIEAAVTNARAFLEIAQRVGSFDEYAWSFVGGESLRGPRARSWDQVPTSSRESDALSKDLKGKGFRFVGTTVCYAFMQAVGMVDDHLAHCFRAGGKPANALR
jgi:DNA-3-methyladenine glycosylase I